MNPTFNSTMFESIKTALENTKSKQGGNFKNILQIAAPATYIVRLLPNIKKPQETFFHYFHHGWNSVQTGQFASITSPSTWGERCPISEAYFKILRDGTEEEKKRAQDCIRRKENWYVNVFVVNDPKTSENNNTVKVLRFGRQLNKIIESAINGDDAEEFGSKIFDLSEKGCNLRIKAELVSDKPGAKKFASYTASKFLAPSAIEGMTEEKMAEVLGSIYDLQSFAEHKTAQEIQDFLDSNYFGKNNDNGPATPEKSAPETHKQADTKEEAEDVPYDEPAKTEAAPTTAAKPAVNDAKVQAILDGLDDLTK